MHPPNELETVRYQIERSIDIHGVCPIRKLPRLPAGDQGLIETLRISHEIFRVGLIARDESRRLFIQDIERHAESDLRPVDVRMPVRWSNGITELASLLEHTQQDIGELIDELERTSNTANFGPDDIYDTAAANAITLSRDKIGEIIPLLIRVQLWCLWAVESVRQVGMIIHEFTNPANNRDLDSNLFAYIAHPPVLVATLSVAAAIEEAGAKYINTETEDSICPNKTRFSKVINLLESHHPISDSYEIDRIRKYVNTPRNDLAHYLSKRDSIRLENAEEFGNAIIYSTKYIREITFGMVDQYLEQYENIEFPTPYPP